MGALGGLGKSSVVGWTFQTPATHARPFMHCGSFCTNKGLH